MSKRRNLDHDCEPTQRGKMKDKKWNVMLPEDFCPEDYLDACMKDAPLIRLSNQSRAGGCGQSNGCSTLPYWLYNLVDYCTKQNSNILLIEWQHIEV